MEIEASTFDIYVRDIFDMVCIEVHQCIDNLIFYTSHSIFPISGFRYTVESHSCGSYHATPRFVKIVSFDKDKCTVIDKLTHTGFK